MKAVRELYNIAHREKDKCEALIKLCKESNTVETKGYLAAAKMVSSKYLVNPFVIIKVFNEGKTLLETLINENPESVELRYLRYTIQVNTPAFVGYNKNKKEDRAFIIQFMQTSTDADLKNHILYYLKDTDDVLPEEEALF
jgi:hypothetical protein